MTRGHRIEGMRSIHWRSRASCFSTAAAALCSGAALAQEANKPGGDLLEEIVVTGIRFSLERAEDIKRNAEVIVDSIASEDLGKFPDSNVAEALQRITGVSVSRNDQGEGNGVTVRGFGPQFNATLLNGRLLPGVSENVGGVDTAPTFSFDSVAAELVAGADVYKSSNATLQEGGIGALINLRTARPFDSPDSRAIVSGKGTYEDLSDHTAQSFFALYSDRFAGDRWGALVSASYQKRDSRTDSASVQSYLPHQNLSNTNSDGTVTLVAEDVFFPRQMTHTVSLAEPERIGFTGVLQFRPTDNLLFTLDGLWNRYKQHSEDYQLSHYFTPDNVTSATIGANGTVTSLTTNENGHTDFTRGFDRTPQTTWAIGLNVDWHSSGGLLTLNFDVSTGSTTNDTLNNSAFAVMGYQNVVNWGYSGSGLPSLSTSGIPTLGIPANTFTDPSLTRAHFITYGTGGETQDTIDAGKIDGVLDFGEALLSKLKFGAYASGRSYRSVATENNVCSFCGYFQPLPASLSSTFDAGSDFLGGGDFPTRWLTFDPDDYVAYLRTVADDPTLYTANPNPSDSGFVREEVAAAYVQVEFAGEVWTKPWSANIGVRYVRSDVVAEGASRVLIDLQDVPGDPTIYNAVYSDGGAVLPVAAEHSYDNLLPALNARLNLTDDWIVRFAASQTLTRPNLNDLTPRLSYDTLRPNNLVASSGNPDLKPYLSTNFDLSLEWYYARGGHVTLALFKKSVDDYIVQSFATEQIAVGNSSGDFPDGTASFRVRRPRNVETAKVEGVEVAFQHSFTYLPVPFDGFGFGANATFVESPSTLSPGDPDTTRSFALEGVGDSQNLMVFYEQGPLGIRASYNHRDDYLQQAFNGEGNEPLFVKGSGQLDAQASYRIGEHISITLEGNNITDTARETYGRYKNQWLSRTETGPRYALGVRTTF